MNDDIKALLDEAGIEAPPEEPEDADAPRVWKVVAGSKTSGLLVREGKQLSSQQLPDRLATGALVEEIALIGERLQFFKLTGEGPREGWVSIKQKGSDLLVPAELQEPAEDEWVYSVEQAESDYQLCGYHMINAENRGSSDVLVEAQKKGPDNSGQLHICCLVCAEAGHLTPMLRAARALASREGIWRVSFVSNAYGANKVKSWLQSDPDTSGKIQVHGYVDGWNQEIQELSNKYSQAEDGKLHGLQNDAVGMMAWSCISEIHNSEQGPALYVVDGASPGYIGLLGALEPTPKYVLSVALVVIASVLYASMEAPVLCHCFELPPSMEGFKKMGTRPAELCTVGIIVDEVKLVGLPKALDDFVNASDLPIVYVSMGSQGIFTREQLRRVAAGLTAPGEWRVIWSLRENQQKLLPGGSPESLGPDFYVSSWLPQAELLQHNKVKAFMSHCGWGATCEAITSCKPVIAFPLFADQNFNAFFMELFGMSKRVGWSKLNLMDIGRVMVRFGQTMALWSANPQNKRLRDRFAAKVLNEDVRSVLKDESFARGAQMLHFHNKRQKGGVQKLAEVVERYTRGEGLPGPPEAGRPKAGEKK